MKINIFGIKISIGKNKPELSEIGAKAKTEAVKKRICEALSAMEKQGISYTEYQLQKQSRLSINTIKKYRDFIKEEQQK
jgi:hypothetical protein